jgi:hypothetical protein
VVRKYLIWVAASALVAVVVGVGAVLALRTDPNSPPPSPSSPSQSPSAPMFTPPQVLTLDPSVALLTAESESATTEFDAGALTVTVSGAGVFRFIHGSQVVDGGRVAVDGLDAILPRFPVGLVAVVSYERDKVPVSFYGLLASSPRQVPGGVEFALQVLDAPGKGSTYTVSGGYDIPERLEHVVVAVSGQVLA